MTSALEYYPTLYTDCMKSINALIDVHPIELINRHLTDYFDNSGLPYNLIELDQCMSSLIELLDLTQSVELCLFVFDEVSRQQIEKELPWRWIGIELAFEVIVVKFRDREQAALACTQGLGDMKTNRDVDIYLDVHNERVSRFKNYLCWNGHPTIIGGKTTAGNE